MTHLEQKLLNKEFVITAELCPPRGVDMSCFKEKARMLKGQVDALNITDNQRSIMRLSSIAASYFVLEEGIEPIFQMTCRDRNRMALQSDLLGAHVLGLRNVLVLTGDDISAGDHKDAKQVFDLESTGLLGVVNDLNNGRNINGSQIEGKTEFFAGAAVNPCAEPTELQLIRMKQKIAAGAEFFQSQVVFDIEKFSRFTEKLDFPVNILAGILVLKSAKMARFINENVPGVKIPDELINELEKAKDPLEKGLEIAVRLIRSFMDLAAGVHIMSVGKEEIVKDILNELKK